MQDEGQYKECEDCTAQQLCKWCADFGGFTKYPLEEENYEQLTYGARTYYGMQEHARNEEDNFSDTHSRSTTQNASNKGYTGVTGGARVARKKLHVRNEEEEHDRHTELTKRRKLMELSESNRVKEALAESYQVETENDLTDDEWDHGEAHYGP